MAAHYQNILHRCLNTRKLNFKTELNEVNGITSFCYYSITNHMSDLRNSNSLIRRIFGEVYILLHGSKGNYERQISHIKITHMTAE
jgi:hypothetical protein